MGRISPPKKKKVRMGRATKLSVFGAPKKSAKAKSERESSQEGEVELTETNPNQPKQCVDLNHPNMTKSKQRRNCEGRGLLMQNRRDLMELSLEGRDMRSFQHKAG